MRGWSRALGIGIGTGLVGVFLGLMPFGIELEKNVGLNWLFKVRGPVAPPGEIVVVAINEETGPRLGFSPRVDEWPRSPTHGRLIDTLVDHDVGVIAFDIYFARPRSPDDDRALARSVARSKRVLLYELLEPRTVPVTGKQGLQTIWLWREVPVPPFDALADAARGLASFPLPKLQVPVYQTWNFKSSRADMMASMPAVALQLRAMRVYETWIDILRREGAAVGGVLPARATEIRTARQLRDAMRYTRLAFTEDPGLAARVLGVIDRLAPAGTGDPERRLLRALVHLYGGPENWFLNFYGIPGTVTTIPYHSVVEGRPRDFLGRPVDLAGKTVFIGYSDIFNAGQLDRFVTPFTTSDGVDLSGVEILATAYGNLLTANPVRQSAVAVTAAVLLLFGLALGIVSYFFPAFVAVPTAVVLMLAYGFAVQTAFALTNLWLPVVVPLFQLPLALVVGLTGQWMRERQRKRQISRAMSYYVPEDIVRDLSEKGLGPDTLNRVLYGTCLATDMSGFTTISETMAPKELAFFMNAYFEALSQPLKRQGVSMTEFRADSIMCAWTAEQPDAAVREKAVLAALEVVEAVGGFAMEHRNMRLMARVGLDDGMLYLGHTGGGGHFVYSILGDCANTASRLEGLNKYLGTHVLAARSVADGLDRFLLRPLGRFGLVGKAEATPVVEVLGRLDAADEGLLRLCERFAGALEAFQAGKLGQASGRFKAILRAYPEDGPSRFYLTLCRDYHRGNRERPEDPSVILMEAK